MASSQELRITTALIGVSLALTACGGKQDDNQQQQRTPQVGFVVAEPTSAEVTTELAGRTAAFEASDVRPQVSGVLYRRLFTEGSLVHQGQPLYQIDPRAYRAATNQAVANLASSQANAEATKAQADRYKPLAEIEAVSKQDYTNAVASARQAAASVQQTRAALDTAQLNLRFTTVPAPISGRIGRSLFTVGALVTASQADPLAQIQRLDPMFVDIQQSAGDLLALRRRLASGGLTATTAAVRLKLDDGSDYGQTGSVEFSEALVDQTTGTVTLRARFPNSQGILLPGMFVRATFAQGINRNAFLVPQQAVSRDPQGTGTVMLVGADNKVVQRKVTTARTQDRYWVVTDGLKAGDKVIVQGLGKLKPGQQVKPVPSTAPQKVQVPQGMDGTEKKQGKAG